MPDSIADQRTGYHGPEITAVIFSVIGLAISGYSLLEGRHQG